MNQESEIWKPIAGYEEKYFDFSINQQFRIVSDLITNLFCNSIPYINNKKKIILFNKNIIKT